MQTTDIVSKFFITEYYTALHNDCKNMSRFYDSDCIVSITMDHNAAKQVKGSEASTALFEECGLQKSVINLDNSQMSVAPVENGGMIILVNGKIRPADGKDRDFSQVFILEKKSTAISEYYVIKCDMLQALEVPEAEQEEVAEIAEESPAQPEKVEEQPAPQPEVKEEPERVQAFIPTFAEAPVEPAPSEEQPIAPTPTPVEPAAEAPVEPVAEVSVEPVAEAPVEPAQPEAPVEPVEPAAPAAPVEEVKEEKKEEKKEEAKEAPAEKKAEEPAAEKKPKKAVNHAVRSNRASQLSRRHEPKRETKTDDGFTVVESRFTAKNKNSESTLFVSFRDPSVNREALRQVFRSVGTVVNVTIPPKKLHGFVDFLEPDAAENAVKRSKEEKFMVGKAVLFVEVKRSKAMPRKD